MQAPGFFELPPYPVAVHRFGELPLGHTDGYPDGATLPAVLTLAVNQPDGVLPKGGGAPVKQGPNCFAVFQPFSLPEFFSSFHLLQLLGFYAFLKFFSL